MGARIGEPPSPPAPRPTVDEACTAALRAAGTASDAPTDLCGRRRGKPTDQDRVHVPGVGAGDGRRDRRLGRFPGDGAHGRGGRVRLALVRRSPADEGAGSRAAGRLGVLVDAGRARRDDGAGRAGALRHLHRLPQPGADRQDRGDGRRDQRRPADPRSRRGLGRTGVHRLRLPLRPPRGPVRGGAGDHHRPDPDRGGRFRGRVLPGRATASCGRAGRGRRGCRS